MGFQEVQKWSSAEHLSSLQVIRGMAGILFFLVGKGDCKQKTPSVLDLTLHQDLQLRFHGSAFTSTVSYGERSYSKSVNS